MTHTTTLLTLTLLTLACSNAGPGRREDSMLTPDNASSTSPGATDAEVEQHLTLAITAHGNRPDLAQKEAALRWLAEHADRAYPLVMSRAKATPTPGLVEVVGRLGRREATSWLGEQLRTSGAATGAAGTALGQSPDPGAREVLVAALTATEPDVVSAALDGLRIRGDRSVCGSLAPLATHADAEVRYVWVRPGAALGCLDPAAPRNLAMSDPDPDVRKLATELAGRTSP
jgi:hypothetical protein